MVRCGGMTRVESVERFTNYGDDAVTVATKLLGQRLVRMVGGRRLAGTIVEVEAYLGAEDRAAHTFGGRRTVRNESMYLPGGHAYVYFTYGMHYCLNIVCGDAGVGTAALIRALEPTEGIEHMFSARPRARRERDLCSGPAKLTQALQIDRAMDGVNLLDSDELFIERVRRRRVPGRSMIRTPRIGVDYAGSWAGKELRFLIHDNPHVSR